MSKVLRVTCCLVLVYGQQVLGDTIIIDTFSVPAGANDRAVSNITNSFALDSTTQAGPSSEIIGGSRYLSAFALGGEGTDSVSTEWNGLTGDPDVDVSIRSGGVGRFVGTSVVEWGNAADLNQDFSSLGSNFEFVLTLEDIDPQANPIPLATIGLRLEDGDSNDVVTLPVLSNGALSPSYVWRSSDFSGIDFGDIDNIRLTINGTASNSQALELSYSSFVAAVPEPSSLSLLGLVAFWGAALHRRR